MSNAEATQKPKFKLGDTVTWRSQAAGTWKEKTGTIVEVVAPRHGSKVIGRTWSNLRHESYIVAVPTLSRTAGRPVNYWPRVSALKAASL